MAYSATPYEIINLGNHQTISLSEMIEGLEQALGVKAAVTHLPDQPGDVPQTWAEIAKAQHLLGCRPQTSFAEGLKHFAAWLGATG